MEHIDFKTIRSWELALSPRYEEGYSVLAFRYAIYRVKIGERYKLTFRRGLKGSRIFTLYCEGVISEQTKIPLGAPLADYTEALVIYAQCGEELEEELSNPDQGRVIFTGDYPSA